MGRGLRSQTAPPTCNWIKATTVLRLTADIRIAPKQSITMALYGTQQATRSGLMVLRTRDDKEFRNYQLHLCKQKRIAPSTTTTIAEITRYRAVSMNFDTALRFGELMMG
jgi:hypothetical protein